MSESTTDPQSDPQNDPKGSFDSKIQDVMRQLERGDVRVVYDAETESVNLVTARELKKYVQS